MHTCSASGEVVASFSSVFTGIGFVIVSEYFSAASSEHYNIHIAS